MNGRIMEIVVTFWLQLTCHTLALFFGCLVHFICMIAMKVGSKCRGPNEQKTIRSSRLSPASSLSLSASFIALVSIVSTLFYILIGSMSASYQIHLNNGHVCADVQTRPNIENGAPKTDFRIDKNTIGRETQIMDCMSFVW